jgi:hypothetical protein
MRKTIIYISLILSLFAISCDNKIASRQTVEYRQGKQVPIIDSLPKDIGILAPDTVIGEEEYYARIWLADKSQKLIDTYVDCDFKNSLIDTINKKIDNCTISLETIKDTSRFHIWPSDTSLTYTFPLTILTLDTQNLYHLKIFHLKFSSKKKTNR